MRRLFDAELIQQRIAIETRIKKLLAVHFFLPELPDHCRRKLQRCQPVADVIYGPRLDFFTGRSWRLARGHPRGLGRNGLRNAAAPKPPKPSRWVH